MQDTQRQYLEDLITHYGHEAAREAELTFVLLQGLEVFDALGRHRVRYPSEAEASCSWSRVGECWVAFLQAAAAHISPRGALSGLDIDRNGRRVGGSVVHRPSPPSDVTPGSGGAR